MDWDGTGERKHSKKQKILMNESSASLSSPLTKHRNEHGCSDDSIEDYNDNEWSWPADDDAIEFDVGDVRNDHGKFPNIRFILAS